MPTTKIELPDMEKVAVAAITLLGKDFHRLAFLMSHPRTKSREENTLNVSVSRWINSPLVKSYKAQLQELMETGKATPQQAKKAGRPKKEIPNDLTTREGIVKQLIDATSYTEGKDSVSALQTLAKLQGYDKPADKDQDDKRSYFLPWVSHCRSCKLMKSYINAITAAGLAQDNPDIMPAAPPDGEDQQREGPQG